MFGIYDGQTAWVKLNKNDRHALNHELLFIDSINCPLIRNLICDLLDTYDESEIIENESKVSPDTDDKCITNGDNTNGETTMQSVTRYYMLTEKTSMALSYSATGHVITHYNNNVEVASTSCASIECAREIWRGLQNSMYALGYVRVGQTVWP